MNDLKRDIHTSYSYYLMAIVGGNRIALRIMVKECCAWRGRAFGFYGEKKLRLDEKEHGGMFGGVFPGTKGRVGDKWPKDTAIILCKPPTNPLRRKMAVSGMARTSRGCANLLYFSVEMPFF